MSDRHAVALLANGKLRLRLPVKHVLRRSRPVYTQGLEFDGGRVIESIGDPLRSEVRIFTPPDDKPVVRYFFPPGEFAEGIALDGELLHCVTWQSRKRYIFGAADLRVLDVLELPADGWGLCADPSRPGLLMTNGSATVAAIVPGALGLRRVLTLRSPAGAAKPRLNDLCVLGPWLVANDYKTERLLVFDRDGRLHAMIDISHLLLAAERAQLHPRAEANGVAVEPGTGSLVVTGKYWPIVAWLDPSQLLYAVEGGHGLG